MLNNYLDEARKLRDRGIPFVLATVVRAERPTSAKPGAKAIITADGALQGWVGGSCAEPSVKREARKALLDGRPRLLRLCPPEALGVARQEGVIEVALTCVSGGTLEIYLEPQLTQPHLVIIGHLATTKALVVLGKALGYPVTVMGYEATAERFPEADRVLQHVDISALTVTPNTFVVVASHGNYDEEALEAALRSEAAYVGLVASRKRADDVKANLRAAGLTEAQLSKLKSPAGLDLGGSAPGELALSILAEIVRLSHREASLIPELENRMPAVAKDVVCGMTVEIETARFTSVHGGLTYYFCSAGCKRSFETEPEAFAVKGGDHAISWERDD